MAEGTFITLEGGEGAGKSTQAALLVEDLRAAGIAAVLTREPGGAPGAEEIRELLVEGAVERWDAVSEALLHYAARNEHVSRLIRPALKAGTWVVSDRFADSTVAYQGYGHGLDLELISRLHALVLRQFAPGLTLILDLPEEQGVARARARKGLRDAENPTRYERMGPDFHWRVRNGFREIVAKEPHRCVLIDAGGGVEEVRGRIRKAVVDRLGIRL